MLTLEEYTWALRIIGTRSFGKFMPHVTLFPVGELLNHDNVETYYIYQLPSEKPDASTRYSGIVDEHDHDDDLLTNDSILNLNCQLVLNISEEINKEGKDREKFERIRKMCLDEDVREDHEASEHRKYRPPDMDLTESEEKEASICAGPNEHYLPGAEVYMSYGRYSNAQLLSTYGFALKENYYNYARIKVLFKELAIDEAQAEFFGKIEAFCIFKLKKNRICIELLRTLRGLNWKNEYPIEAFLGHSMLELEIKIIAHAMVVLQKVLAHYPTSHEEDLRILTEDIPLRKYFAVLYRSQIKEIIMAQIKYLEIAKTIVERMHAGLSLEVSLGPVEAHEEASGNSYLDIEANRRALSAYLKI